MRVYSGTRLWEHIEKVADYPHARSIVDLTGEWLAKDHWDRNSLVLSGLQRTGKTVAMLQAAARLPSGSAAYLMPDASDTWDVFCDTVNSLERQGVDTFFLDEVSRFPDFIGNAGQFSDIWKGSRFVMTGTLSLSFAFAERGPLFGRADFLSTTWIPWHEHRDITGAREIDDYIEHGGILSPEASFGTYILDSIAPNIRESLMNAGRTALGRLADCDEGVFMTLLNNAVNHDQHALVLSILRDWELYDLKMARARLSGKPEGKLLRRLDPERLLKDVTDILGMKEKRDWEIPFGREEAVRFKSLMERMRIFAPAMVFDIADIAREDFLERVSEYSDPFFKDEWLLLQPGLRWNQVKAVLVALKNALEDRIPSGEEKVAARPLLDFVFKSVADNARGRILEGIVSQHVRAANPGVPVFAFRNVGEIDIVVAKNDGLELFEVKNAKTRHSAHLSGIGDKRMLAPLEKRFGNIRDFSVIYRGPTDGVWKNAADFLSLLEPAIRKRARQAFSWGREEDPRQNAGSPCPGNGLCR